LERWQQQYHHKLLLKMAALGDVGLHEIRIFLQEEAARCNAAPAPVPPAGEGDSTCVAAPAAQKH
jgi:hypothetical protein